MVPCLGAILSWKGSWISALVGSIILRITGTLQVLLSLSQDFQQQNPDRLASGGMDASIKIWDLSSAPCPCPKGLHCLVTDKIYLYSCLYLRRCSDATRSTANPKPQTLLANMVRDRYGAFVGCSCQVYHMYRCLKLV